MDDMIKVVEEGAWAIKGQPFFMKKWTKSQTMCSENIEKVMVWAKFYGLPLEFWSSMLTVYV